MKNARVMRKLIQKIRANRFVSAVLVLMSGTALGQVIGLLDVYKRQGVGSGSWRCRFRAGFHVLLKW